MTKQFIAPQDGYFILDEHGQVAEIAINGKILGDWAECGITTLPCSKGDIISVGRHGSSSMSVGLTVYFVGLK